MVAKLRTHNRFSFSVRMKRSATPLPQLLLPRPYLVLTKPLRLDIQCQRGASVKIGWKYLDD